MPQREEQRRSGEEMCKGGGSKEGRKEKKDKLSDSIRGQDGRSGLREEEERQEEEMKQEGGRRNKGRIADAG